MPDHMLDLVVVLPAARLLDVDDVLMIVLCRRLRLLLSSWIEWAASRLAHGGDVLDADVACFVVLARYWMDQVRDSDLLQLLVGVLVLESLTIDCKLICHPKFHFFLQLRIHLDIGDGLASR